MHIHVNEWNVNEWTTGWKWMWEGMRGYKNEERRRNRQFGPVLTFACQTNRQTDQRTDMINYRGARTRMRKKEQLDVTRVEHGGWNSESECMTTRKKALTNVLRSLAYVKAASTLPFLGFGISYRVGKIRLLIDRWKGVHWPITCIYLMCRLSSCEFGHRRPKMIVVEEKYISPSI